MTNKYPSYGPVATLNQKNYTPVANCKSLQSVCFALLHRISSVSAVIEIFLFSLRLLLLFSCFPAFYLWTCNDSPGRRQKKYTNLLLFYWFCWSVFFVGFTYACFLWSGMGMGDGGWMIPGFRGETDTWKYWGGNRVW